ncbi:MAG: hypothetical protein KKE17_10550 [Proteobacteria bacterium]|nr:hypothetical protein [Pseudomonadota bacterium]MBU1710431.1 hypothetical protein [Pseudomonadota bacterium]
MKMIKWLPVFAVLSLCCGCNVVEGVSVRLREKSTIELVVLNNDRTPAQDITVTIQESGPRHIVPVPWTKSWMTKQKPRTHVSDDNGICRIDFGDRDLDIISVSSRGKKITDYEVIHDYWWIDQDKKQPPDKHLSWQRSYNPKTNQLLGHKAEMIIGTE